ncbi:hypothetical protein NM688_g5434 [Phlebia brevispora]|uniref:Uncharacterized protein n=1 Tax=Phlebia brevispora TaxID=194682 RepID=A0ACC1SV89_9APHY|nr:hypothetical protein NM688_g5434 [Phlebia brevispora]
MYLGIWIKLKENEGRTRTSLMALGIALTVFIPEFHVASRQLLDVAIADREMKRDKAPSRPSPLRDLRYSSARSSRGIITPALMSASEYQTPLFATSSTLGLPSPTCL